MKECNFSPSCIIVAGPNGSGKTTFVNYFLSVKFSQHRVLNYDEIIKKNKIKNPVSLFAGKRLRYQFEDCLSNFYSFIYETTLSDSSSYLTGNITKMQNENWDVVLYFLWISSYNVSLRRVAQRVATGGHDVNKEHIVVRYQRSIKNLMQKYLPICNTILCFENESTEPNLIFSKIHGKISIFNKSLYNVMLKQ